MTLTLTREEAQQVLDALDEYRDSTEDFRVANRCISLIQILRARLSAPEPQPMRLRRGDILRCIETNELCTVWATSKTGKTQVKWKANDFGSYTAEQIGDLFWVEPKPERNCTRSHPHENMGAMCELRTEIARLTNENARLKSQPEPEPVALAWAEGYKAGIEDERSSEANIGIAGFGAKVEPARQNPYTAPPQPEPSCKTGSQCIGGKCPQCVAPEPVAWIYEDDEGRMMFSQMPTGGLFWEPVYRKIKGTK